MNRRDLLKGLAVLPLLSTLTFGNNSVAKKIIKPKRLKIGDTVGLIAPASAVAENEFNRALENIKNLGFVPKVGKNAQKRYNFLAGTDKERLEDLHWAFSDDEVKAVWCIRGGFGTSRILPEIDYNLIRKNPKILIGYSDITTLLTAVYQNSGLVVFHGPGGSSTYSDYTKKHVLDVLTSPSTPYKIELSADNQAREEAVYKTEVITKGKAKGKLIGGNLSLLVAIAGTKYALKNTKGKILFIEDVNEPPYKVDRMLTQLRQTIDMKQLAGIALGIFADNSTPRRTNTETQPTTPQPPSPTIIDVFKDRLGDLGIPVVYGLSFGHIRDQFTLPVGIEAQFDTENSTMTLLENAVV